MSTKGQFVTVALLDTLDISYSYIYGVKIDAE